MLKIPAKRLKIILDSMSSKSIMVIGDLMLDEYIWGHVERLSPEAPVPVIEVQEESYKLGGAGNVANNLLSLGAKAAVSSVIGRDKHGEILSGILGDLNIPPENIFEDKDRKTIVKTRIIAHTQQIARVDKEDRTLISAELRSRIISSVKSSISTNHAIIISDYGKGVIGKELIDEIVKIAKENHVIVCVDPKERNFQHYKDVNIITPNTKELSFGSGIKVEDYHDTIRAAQKVKQGLGCETVLVTRGEHGMSLFDKDSPPTDIPTRAKAVFDVTGAGDTVIACFTLALSSGATPKEAAIIANVAAGVVVGKVGAASVAWQELFDMCMEEICG